MLQVASSLQIQVAQANKPISPRLSVERDFRLMTPWMELLKTAKPTFDTRAQKKIVGKSALPEASPPQTPRRVTRALARKLRQHSIGSVTSKQEETSENAEQLTIHKDKRDGKGGRRSRDTVSASPPAIVVYTEHGVKIEAVSSARRSDAPVNPNETVIRDATAQMSEGGCSGCGVKATPLAHRDHTGRALCEHCHRTIADAEKDLQAEIQERRLKLRDDAILLPPPSTHKISTRIRENLSGKVSAPKRQEGTDLLPILKLDEPRTMFASYRQFGPTRSDLQQRTLMRGSGPSSGEAGQLAISKTDKRYAMISARSHPPNWHVVRSAPYRPPVPAQVPPRTIASMQRERFAYQPYSIGAMRSAPPRESALVLLDIKRRRSVLLDLREVALDLLEETSTVLTQLDKALPKLAAKRGKLVKPSQVA